MPLELIGYIITSNALTYIVTHFLTRKQSKTETERTIQLYYSKTIEDMYAQLDRLRKDNEMQEQRIIDLQKRLDLMIEKETEYLRQANSLREERNHYQNKYESLYKLYNEQNK